MNFVVKKLCEREVLRLCQDGDGRACFPGRGTLSHGEVMF